MSRFRYSIRAVQDNGQEITLLETNYSDLAIKGFELHGMVIPEHNRLGLARIVRLEMHEDVVLDKTLFSWLPETDAVKIRENAMPEICKREI